ncbi:MAG: hypothetical protein H9W81_12425 [Enterococcus sp.]|nr:hypothetical protein [Enterococcus sp.]
MSTNNDLPDAMETTRRSRKTQHNQLPKFSLSKFSMNNKVKVGIAVILAVLIALLAGKVITSFSTKDLSEKVSVSKWANFENVKSVEGFTDPAPRSYTGATALVAKQTTNSITKNDGSCEFFGQISHIPSYNAGRGDRYLSENYLYTLAEGNGVTPELDSVKFKSKSGKIEAVNASYEYETVVTKGTSEETETIKKYRSVAVRVFDSAVEIDGLETSSEGQFGSDPKKGLPVVVFTYECNSENDFSEKDLKKLISSTTVDLNASDMPEYDNGQEPVQDDPSETSQPVEVTSTEPAQEAPVVEEPVQDETVETETEVFDETDQAEPEVIDETVLEEAPMDESSE